MVKVPASFTDVGLTPEDIENYKAVDPVQVALPPGFLIVIRLAELTTQLVGLAIKQFPFRSPRVQAALAVSLKKVSVVGNYTFITESAARLLARVKDIR